MCESFTLAQLGGAVTLAVLSPQEWHDILTQLVRQRLGTPREEKQK